jgi:hypothetical protein
VKSIFHPKRESLIGGAFDTGVIAERERIIKLLEGQMNELEPLMAQWQEPALQRWKELEMAIALIKGENK